MKKLILITLVLSVTIYANAQKVIKKAVPILKAGNDEWPIQLSKYSIDTTYGLVYRNFQYTELNDLQHIFFTKEELKKFSKALSMAANIGNDEKVKSDGYTIEKVKSSYECFFDKGILAMKAKELTKMIDVINKE